MPKSQQQVSESYFVLSQTSILIIAWMKYLKKFGTHFIELCARIDWLSLKYIPELKAFLSESQHKAKE